MDFQAAVKKAERDRQNSLRIFHEADNMFLEQRLYLEALRERMEMDGWKFPVRHDQTGEAHFDNILAYIDSLRTKAPQFCAEIAEQK